MSWRKAVRALMWMVVASAILVGVGYVFLDPWTVPGDDAQFAVSIEPTMSVGDLVLVLRSKGASDGALVRCVDPDAPGRFVVGRVVARSGDKVEFANGNLTLDGKVPPASLACDQAIVRLKNPTTQEDEELACSLEELAGSTHYALRAQKSAAHEARTEVEPGKVFLVSDNRAMHLDSRDFNAIQPAMCQRIMLRLWGPTGWSDAKKRLTVLW